MKKLICLYLLIQSFCYADDLQVIELRVENHKFNIEHLELKANQKYKFKVYNADSTSEEFESKSMVVEKFIGPKKTINFILGPFRPGSYEYFGCFHPSTAKGIVLIK